MTSSTKKILQYGVSFLLMAVFLYFAFRGTDFGELWSILRTANYWWALAMVPPLFISHLLRSWRWEYLLRPVKKGLRFRNLFSALIVGYMLNNIFIRAGELARPLAIGKLEGVSRSAALGTVIVERIFDMLSFLVVVGLIPLVYSGPLLQSFPWLVSVGIWTTIITLAVLAAFAFLMMRRDIVEKLLKLFTRRLSPKYRDIIERFTHSFLDGFLFLKDPSQYFMITLLSILIWVFYIVMMYFPFLAFGLNNLGWDAALVIQAISSIGFIVPTPGATGSYHYFVIQTMTKLYSVNEEVARSYATVTHAIGFIATILVGIYFFFKDKLHVTEEAAVAQTRPRNTEALS
jgi:glycosyltransferase 2 family protein